MKLLIQACLLYTSDAADERSSVDLGGRRIIKKKKYRKADGLDTSYTQQYIHTKDEESIHKIRKQRNE